MASAPSDFLKELGNGTPQLKKTNTAEKKWTPTADGTALGPRCPAVTHSRAQTSRRTSRASERANPSPIFPTVFFPHSIMMSVFRPTQYL